MIHFYLYTDLFNKQVFYYIINRIFAIRFRYVAHNQITATTDVPAPAACFSL